MSEERQFPIGFWNYVPIARQGPEDVTDWAEAGMTRPMGPRFGPDDVDKMNSILDRAQENGMHVILCHEQGFWRHLVEEGAETYRRDFQRAAEQLGDHPAVHGFNVGDEPQQDDFPALCEAMRIQKEVAPHLEPFANLMNCHPGCERLTGYRDWGKYLDDYVQQSGTEILCYDCYSHMNPGTEGWDHYFSNLRLFYEASRRHGIPYWTTLLSAGHWRFRPPSEDDFRWQLSTALAHGARGILWFFFYMRAPHGNYRTPPIDEHYERTETYDRLSRVCRTFLKSQAPVMRDLTLQRSFHVGESWGGWPAFEAAGRLVSAESEYDVPLICSEFRDGSGRPYVMVVNNSPWEPTRAEVHVRGERPLLHRVGWRAREEPQGGEGRDYCRIHRWLAPGQMELFRVEDGGTAKSE